MPANAKWYRNLVIAESIVEALRAHRKDWEKKLDEMGKAGKAELEAYLCATRQVLNQSPVVFEDHRGTICVCCRSLISIAAQSKERSCLDDGS